MRRQRGSSTISKRFANTERFPNTERVFGESHMMRAGCPFLKMLEIYADGNP